MKILLVHNAYQQRGGEDAVFAAEAQLLAAQGHGIVQYHRHNDELRSGGWFGAALAGVNTVWSSGSYRALRDLLANEKPEVAHFHNTFPLISPAAYYACAEAGVPVVQTLHNYRLLCPAATFLRDGRMCESCLGRSVPWPGIVHGCYRDSRAATTAVSGMLTMHRALQTWKKKVDVYIVLSEFAREKFIEGGLPPERIVVIQNFVSPDPGPKTTPGEYALFVGRLSEEKGLGVLLAAWKSMGVDVPLRIAGNGPLRRELEAEAQRGEFGQISFLGQMTHAEILGLMKGARLLVFPSVWYEGFPMTIAEAFACGLPVIASRLGAMAEIVEDGHTGLHFTPGDAADLAAKVDWAWTHPREMQEMGRAARAEYEAKYTAEKNYELLMGAYEFARERRS
ncbi:MAG: glycosyltransferase [Nitrospirae bacterium]|nr:glycosyltransferase [Nitrospirota bacterium]